MKGTFTILVIACTAALSATAGAGDFADQALVVSSTPNMVASPPDCRPQAAAQAQQPSQDRSVLGMVAGAALGGLAGHQVGKGRGQTVATIGGAVAGAVVGEKIANTTGQQPAQSMTPQGCVQMPPQQRGWLTTYTYNGRTFNGVTSAGLQPGQSIGVMVHVDTAN